MASKQSDLVSIVRLAVQRFGSTVILVLVALALILLFLLFTVRVQEVKGTEVGVKINNLTGDIDVIQQSGTAIYNGLFSSFYLLDTTVQRIEMVEKRDASGNVSNRDDLRIKTVDGSDVYLDLTINYRIDKAKVQEIVQTSGVDDAYKLKWVRDYSRSICRTVFGEMTTEEFYDAAVRNQKALAAEQELNANLNPYGIIIERVIAEKFRFHPEYEEKIRAKKLADQEVEEQISKANAARQKQETRVVTAEKQKLVYLAEVEGKMQQLIVQAEAEAEKAINEAEAFAIETRLGADADFYRMEQNAQAILAAREAEAKATAAMADALSGMGGYNLVKMAYAERLKGLRLSGQPFVISGTTERFSHMEEGPGAPPSAHKTSAAE